jgi:hypothetical protein
VPEGGDPIELATIDALQIGFRRGTGRPTDKGKQKVFQGGKGEALGEVRCGHVKLDSYIGEMFKKESGKIGFFKEMMGGKNRKLQNK